MIDITSVIENGKVGRFGVLLVLVSWFVTFFDGFDMIVISYTAPYIAEDYGLNELQLGNVFSSGLVGMMVGGFVLGYLGDRVGRRPVIVGAAITSSLVTLSFSLAQSYEQLLILRFLNGMALGGLLPLCWALNIEYVPKRFRATVVTLIMVGFSIGSATAGPVTVAIAPDYGWQGVFVFGGLATAAAAVLLFFVLPESMRFLAVKERRPDLIARTLNRLNIDQRATASDRFIVADEASAAKENFNVTQLFRGALVWITPLLWVAYIASSMTIYLKASWSPLIFEEVGMTRNEAAIYSSVLSLAGAAGGLALMRFTDRRGVLSMAVMPVIAVPALLIIGLTTLTKSAFIWLNLVANVAFGGAHYGAHSIAGIFYPSAIRSNGTGWATSIAKLGSIAGPLIGGVVLATNLPAQRSFIVMAMGPLIFGICIVTMGLIQRRARAEGRDAEAQDAAPAAASAPSAAQPSA